GTPESRGALPRRGSVRRQGDGLRPAPDSPPALSVPQRLRRVDRPAGPVPGRALDQIIGWLTTDEPRFILVLGSFGYGKTFLTHQLALELPRRLPHLDPMLVELRQLEKSPDLDRLVAQHLVDSQVRRPDLDPVRHLLAQRRPG